MYNKLPDTYVMQEIKLNIPSLKFNFTNEFDQKLLELKMDQFFVDFSQCKKYMKAKMKIEDFEIEDCWSGAKNWKLLIEAKEDGGELMSDFRENEQDKKELALYVTYEAN